MGSSAGTSSVRGRRRLEFSKKNVRFFFFFLETPFDLIGFQNGAP